MSQETKANYDRLFKDFFAIASHMLGIPLNLSPDPSVSLPKISTTALSGRERNIAPAFAILEI